MKILVAQRGARRHYAVARALYNRDLLAGLVTDWYAPDQDGYIGRMIRRMGSKPLRRALGRRAQGLPDNLVYAWGLRSLAWEIAGRIYAWRGGPHAGHLVTDRAFSTWVSRQDLPSHEIFFGFSYASLEAMRREKQQGVFTVLDQFNPAQLEDQWVRQEMEKWPDYATMPPPVPEAYYERVREEWELADLIIVNSEWTVRALLEQGVPKHKIELGSLAYEPPEPFSSEQHPSVRMPLRVLWVGTVSVRKGIPYLVEAARMLEGKPVQFTVAGPLDIKTEALRNAPSNIRWLGQVPRPEVANLYRTHHVFVLPTISDNLPSTQLEALSYGLPVIITPNCGHMVQDGKTGFVIPPFSAEALAEVILRFAKDPLLVDQMAPQCIKSANQYSIEAYASRLISIIQSHIGRPKHYQEEDSLRP